MSDKLSLTWNLDDEVFNNKNEVLSKGKGIKEKLKKKQAKRRKAAKRTAEAERKKLSTLLRKKAAKELRKEQEWKAEERLRMIAETYGTKADLDSASMDDLKKICQQYFDKWYSLEGEMFFLQREVILRDLQINELTISVSDMKGKFIKPTLKKVSKYENKFAKLQEKAAKFAFANQLKQSKG